jgi:3-oxoacyl-[acyl-carrier protein] reductase
MLMAKPLTGKVALVTGGSRGIGAATARALADEGADVAISYMVSSDKAAAVTRELEGKGIRTAAFRADQAYPAQVEGLIKTVVERFGRLDILVNNAGVFAGGAVDNPASNVAEFDRQFAVNVGGVVTAIRAASKVMGGGGRIISVSSCLATLVGFPGLADYAATKAAIVGYSKGAARDLAPRKITVNVVQPGATDTEMAPKSGPFPDYLHANTALGRYGRPEEIAAAIAFLASPRASYITGTVLLVDGGLSA